MLLAMIDDVRTPPAPGLVAKCPACGALVIAKCGEQRMHHWAHRGRRACDPWWETETDWHRRWKLHFPPEQQEVIHRAPNGEKHIADVQTQAGFTIEFQHSALAPQERTARETFYKDIVWVVDGLRLSRDLPRFRDGVEGMRPFHADRIFIHASPDMLFPRAWLNARAPVFFDFGVNAESGTSQSGIEACLWGLLPGRAGREAVILRFTRDEFLVAAREDHTLLLARTLCKDIEARIAAQRRNAGMARSYANLVAARQLLQQRRSPYGPRRRF